MMNELRLTPGAGKFGLYERTIFSPVRRAS